MTTLQQLYEEQDAKTLTYRVIVAGADITYLVTGISWSFAVGEVPSATFTVPFDNMVSAIAEEAAVEIWVGFEDGFTSPMALVFGGGVINSVSARGVERVVECIQDGARRLNFPYYREISYEFDTVTAQEAATALLDLAGVPVYVVDLDPWLIGTAVPQTLKFSSYGDAINKVSTVDGSPWFALPSGQVRVEKRDPLPYDNPARTYYSGVLNGIVESQPAGISNPSALPRILELAKSFDRPGVNNFINIDGATLVTLGPNGEQNSDQIHEEVDGAPGVFANGAPWITTPPLFQPFTYNNELIDTNAKAFAVAERYYALKNRLIQNVSLSIPLDPMLFLCMTVKVVDPNTETNGLYFLQAYSCSLSDRGATSDLTLLGGPFAGTQGFASPFAEFRWTYQAMYSQIGGNNAVGGVPCQTGSADLNLGWQSSLAAKLCQDLPENTGDANKGGDRPTAQATVMIGFDATYSQDFDGVIASYAWADDQGNTATGPRVTFIYNPDDVSSIEMTLTVTDDTARTDSITKTVFTSAASRTPPNPAINDTNKGGGVASGDCTDGGDEEQGGSDPGGANGMALVYAVAAMCKAMMSKDNRTWNMLDKDDLGVGNFTHVDARATYADGSVTALFGTDEGDIVRTTDGAETGTVVRTGAGGDERITDISYDSKNCNSVSAMTNKGQILTSTDDGRTWANLRPRDGLTINKIIQVGDRKYFFGGDTGRPETLIRTSTDGGRTMTPVALQGSLLQAVRNAGAGNSISTASINDEKLLIGFSGGVSPHTWTNGNPIKNPADWSSASGITGNGVLSSAPGAGGDFIVSTEDGTFNTSDNENFTAGCATPQNDLYWEGLPGVYIGANDGGMSKIVDDTCGTMTPNPSFPDQTEIPGCAIIKKIKVIPEPRSSDPCGAWPANTDPGILTSTLLASQGVGGGSMSNSFVVPDLDGQLVLLLRINTDEDGIFDVTDDLAVQAIGAGDELKVVYSIVEARGQTINWSMTSGGGAINYTVYMITPSSTFVEVTAVNFQQFTNTASANTSITAPSDWVLSDRGIGFNNIPVTLATMQSPLFSLVGAELGRRLGQGDCNWAGGSSPGVFYIWNVGLRTRKKSISLHSVEGAHAGGYGSSPFLNGGPFSVLGPAAYDRVIVLSLTHSDPPTNNLTWHQYNAGGPVEVYYAYLAAGQSMNNIIVNNIAPFGEVGNPVALYIKPNSTDPIRGRVDYALDVQHTAISMYDFTNTPVIEECGGNYGLVVSGPDDGPATGGFDFIIPSTP